MEEMAEEDEEEEERGATEHEPSVELVDVVEEMAEAGETEEE